MSQSAIPAPLIVIGMHRSGTSMITDFLEQLGLFMGRDQNGNQESMFFLHTNRWLLRQSGGAWDHPEPVDSLMHDPDVRPLLGDFVRFTLQSPRVALYLGWPRYLRYRSVFKLPVLWGWKDPRNTFTLPLWLDLFPEAKVLHIYRNGVDVASSLHVRGEKGLASGRVLQHWNRPSRRPLYRVWPQLFPPFTTRHMSLATGFALWETYTRRADEHIAALPPERTRVVQYEYFLQDPLPVLRDLCAFTGVQATEAQLEAAGAKVNPSRGRAYERDETLLTFYNQVKSSPQMLRYGY